MDILEFLNGDPQVLRRRINLVSSRTDISEILLEKDLWVTFLLKYLFGESPWKDHILFKGGTCLSKCYGAVDRFSEDIDILLDWRVLGYGADGPAVEPSRKKQENSNELLVERTGRFIAEEFVPALQKAISDMIDRPIEVRADGLDISIGYPALFTSEYVTSEVLIEMGPRGRWGTPVDGRVSSYVSQNIDALDDSASVRCIPLEQAFCEKVQILHTAAARGKVPSRYSRHYYDVYMIRTKIGHMPIDHDMLARNAEYDRRFYPGAKYGYDTMVPGTYRLTPTEEMLPLLKEDYRKMESMIFGPIPSFEDILKEIAEVEKELNGEPSN
ncbi:MAG: nucleotidyl transferase AbiEii/AbiGii toxin family protein [Candidatus Methanomethylophilaceae archaeon]|nr:nucleotidyl transferase AbiEii/AbiGii toxin family protein [Candidatus Methanomethylophilaceae archaeon]